MIFHVARGLASHLRLKLIVWVMFAPSAGVARGLASHLRLKQIIGFVKRPKSGVARGLASHLRLKPKEKRHFALNDLSRQGAGISSEIETNRSVAPGQRCAASQGAGISSEIETCHLFALALQRSQVARGLASHLRLKLIAMNRLRKPYESRQGAGISSEIETQIRFGKKFTLAQSPGGWHLI